MPDATNKNREYWKSTILKINDRKLLDYIKDIVELRISHARADHNFDKPEPKKGKDGKMPYVSSYDPPPRKMKPLSMSKLMKAGEEKEEPVY